MKKITTLAFCATLLLNFWACDTAKKIKETSDNLSAATEAATNLQDNMEAASKRLEERRAKGDTLAMPYKELQAYLPEVSGFDKDGEPSGSSTGMMGVSLSVCEQKFKKGNSQISVTLTDYNAGYAAFMGVTAMMKAGFSSEDESQRTGAVKLDIEGVSAYETVQKQDKTASLLLAIADRFFVEIKGNNMDNSDALVEIAKAMKLSDLAAK